MHILVTGASGFIGRALVRRLVASGHDVTALTRPGKSAETAETLHYALGSREPLKLPRGIDSVVHLAQSRSYRGFPSDASEMFRVNVAGTQSLLEAAAKADVRHFCLVSSGTVYEPYNRPLTEDAPLAPTSYLGASKLAAEIIARPFASLFDLPVMRLFMPYGPGQAERLIPTLIKHIREGRAVTLPESGDGMRFTPTHVEDVCDVIVTAISDGWTDTCNVACPTSTTIKEIAEIIGKLLGKKAKFQRMEQSASVIIPDLTRLEAKYDIARFRSIEDGLNTCMESWTS